MAALYHGGADAPGSVTPATSDDARELDGGAGTKDQGKADTGDCLGSGFADQAALLIEGEQYALAYLQRLHADMAQPGELAVILSFLGGEMLHGACRTIEKALRGAR